MGKKILENSDENSLSSIIDLSIIIPIYNEEEVLPFLYERLTKVLEKLNLNYEIIFVNDGSKDNSLQSMKEFAKANSKVRILSLSRNFGHQSAITAGFDFSKGRAVMTMDGDLQDPPEIIPTFLESWRQGNEIVYGVRIGREEGFIKRSCYKFYYKLLRRLSNVEIPLDSGDCCLMDRKVVELLNSLPERNRFIRGLRSWTGFKQAGIGYKRTPRKYGKSKYNFFKLLKLGMDGIISFSEIPLKISIFMGFVISALSILYAFFIVINRILRPAVQIPGWTSIIVTISFLSGIQLIIIGVLGEYIVRIFDEVKGRPQYILEEIIGFKDEET